MVFRGDQHIFFDKNGDVIDEEAERAKEKKIAEKRAQAARIIKCLEEFTSSKYGPDELMKKLVGLGLDPSVASPLIPFPSFLACDWLKVVAEALNLQKPQDALTMDRKTAEKYLGLCSYARLQFMPPFIDALPEVPGLPACIKHEQGRKWFTTKDLMTGNTLVRFCTKSAKNPRKNVAAVLQVVFDTTTRRIYY